MHACVDMEIKLWRSLQLKQPWTPLLSIIHLIKIFKMLVVTFILMEILKFWIWNTFFRIHSEVLFYVNATDY
jgi:hypothetical protein